MPNKEQPTFCLYCHVHIPQIRLGKYKGEAAIRCGKCDESFDKLRYKNCPNCQADIALNDPLPLSNDTEAAHREKNRKALAKQILEDPKMHKQVIGMLGLDRLSKVEQGVALSAISKEKLHPLSGEYNFKEAHTLIDLAYGVTLEIGEKWAINIVKLRLSMYYIRAGREMLATILLTDLLKEYSGDTELEMLRNLEVKSYIGLAHRLAGNSSVADKYSKDTYNQLANYFEELQPKIDQYLKLEEKKSEFLGPLEDGGTFPRIDMIGSILAVLVEEAIVKGDNEKQTAYDDVLDRMLELDNIIGLLEQITPIDDPGFFAAHLREYIRLFSAIFWYPEYLIYNDDLKRQVLLELGYKRIKAWMNRIPIEYWLQLRPARLIEIFSRASEWNENIDQKYLVNRFLNDPTNYHQPSFMYIISDAYANLGKYEESIELIQKLLKHEKTTDTLRVLGEKLLITTQLEMYGILIGVETVEPRINLPVSIQLEQRKSSYEPETYMKEVLGLTKPVLRLNFEQSEFISQGIAIFGEKLLAVTKSVEEHIISVGNHFYNDYFWDYGQQLTAWGIIDPNQFEIDGIRMEAVIIQTVIRDQPIYLLFEGDMQKMEKLEKELILHPSSLLVLRGMIQHVDLEENEILQLLSKIMGQDSDTWNNTTVFTLKSKDE